jgi:hypothetical protein
MIKTPQGTNEDGTPRYNFELTQDEVDQGLVAFVTGPISGTIAMADGTAYNVTDWAIPVQAIHVGQLHVAIHQAHHAAGRFLDQPVPDAADLSVT